MSQQALLHSDFPWLEISAATPLSTAKRGVFEVSFELVLEVGR
jgi:hypothetical protein